jgi:hypothetical protein
MRVYCYWGISGLVLPRVPERILKDDSRARNCSGTGKCEIFGR